MSQWGPLRILRAVALGALVAGASGSVALTLRAGRRNNSLFLLALFAIWVLSPFVGLAAADVISKRWSAFTRATLHGLMLVVTLGSLAAYSGVFSGPSGSRPAFVFLVAPLGSWLLTAIVVPIAAWANR